MFRFLSFLCLLALLSLLIACSQQPAKPDKPSRYHVEKDFIPTLRIDPDTVKDAIPRKDPVTKAGNKNPYTVLGKTYELLPTAVGYKERGGASWYGLKFHGHKTSNGEIYSVYGMTAAHKTLPIPCYVKVTNLVNGKTAIVRVNDRGPFHEGRIIDLSYAAASKLGYVEQGTTQVEVEWIDPDVWQQPVLRQQEPADVLVQPSPAKPVEPEAVPENTFKDPVMLQLAAYVQKDRAQKFKLVLEQTLSYPVVVDGGKDQYHRVKLGPIERTQVQTIRQKLLENGFPEGVPVPVVEPR